MCSIIQPNDPDCQKTKEMLMVEIRNDGNIHNECSVSRIKRDEAVEGKIEVSRRFNVFGTSPVHYIILQPKIWLQTLNRLFLMQRK